MQTLPFFCSGTKNSKKVKPYNQKVLNGEVNNHDQNTNYISIRKDGIYLLFFYKSSYPQRSLIWITLELLIMRTEKEFIWNSK